ncbi:hypothetical protein AYI69_g288 [Smittium culicis]|uniref:Uncharacterized protein n=1 Tax=Smittium culicis TaxID=133412 RepID=A0A1R1YTF9_9FUNG|nr:hypothetical protein AYI69_g288 [Smittium culicis]
MSVSSKDRNKALEPGISMGGDKTWDQVIKRLVEEEEMLNTLGQKNKEVVEIKPENFNSKVALPEPTKDSVDLNKI